MEKLPYTSFYSQFQILVLCFPVRMVLVRRRGRIVDREWLEHGRDRVVSHNLVGLVPTRKLPSGLLVLEFVTTLPNSFPLSMRRVVCLQGRHFRLALSSSAFPASKTFAS